MNAPPNWPCSAAPVGPIKPAAGRFRALTLKLARIGMGADKPEAKSEDLRRARLAASLRENLKRRKAQSRARAAEPRPSERSDARTPADPARR
jgi:hypothetical protein